MRRALIAAGVAAGLLGTAAPAARPDSPVNFIGVRELKQRLDAGEKADIIDVRSWSEFVELHIAGARSIPLRSLPERADEIPRRGLVVLY